MKENEGGERISAVSQGFPKKRGISQGYPSREHLPYSWKEEIKGLKMGRIKFERFFAPRLRNCVYALVLCGSGSSQQNLVLIWIQIFKLNLLSK